MSPIEAHLQAQLAQRLAERGVNAAQVQVLAAEAENWGYRIEAGRRVFEIAFSHRARLACREVSPGREKHLVSNDHPPVNTSAEAMDRGIRLVCAALSRPDFPPRDPPVI